MNKTILITGAATGIGRDAAFALATRGHQVYASAFNDEQADALRAECATRQLPLNIFRMDITSEADRAQINALKFDVLINNAGIGESGSLAEVDIARIRKVFEVNLFATLALTQIALKPMIERGGGTVLFVSSIAGRVPMPFLMPYSMTKFALSAAGAGLRAEMDQLGRNVQIALIEPGAIHTGFNQTMMGKKYDWMGPNSYFHAQAAQMKAKERKTFAFLEARTTHSIVKQIIKAAEARRPRLRYVAPWIQGVMIRLARMAGV